MTDNDADLLQIEVVYARAEQQSRVDLRVARGTTVRSAVLQSDLHKQFSELDPFNCPVGVFGCQVNDKRPVQNGDRVEIYRPLPVDPRSARRQRARQNSSGPRCS